MPRKELSFSIPTKFDVETLKELREIALENERSLSGEIRYRVIKTLKPRDAEQIQAERPKQTDPCSTEMPRKKRNNVEAG